MVGIIYVYVDMVFGVYGSFYLFIYFFCCLLFWVSYMHVLYFCICACSAQVSMFHMERRSRNALIIIIIIKLRLQRSDKCYTSFCCHIAWKRTLFHRFRLK